MFSDAQKERIRRFADRITPPTWQIVLEPRDERKEPGCLNIHIHIQGPKDEIYTDTFGNRCYPHKDTNGKIWYANQFGEVLSSNQIKPILGMIYGRMVFKELKKPGYNGSGKVANIIVKLWPYIDDWKVTLIHELAHVAVYRYQCCRTKSYKKKALFKRPWDIDLKSVIIQERFLHEGHHGPTFQKALRTLIQRAIKEFGTELPQNDVFWKSMFYEFKSLTNLPDTARQLYLGEAGK